MTTCWACEAPLDPKWKFCTRCGVPIEKDAAIPSAIRPDEAPAAPSLSPLATFGWIMGGIGAALLIAGVALFLILR